MMIINKFLSKPLFWGQAHLQTQTGESLGKIGYNCVHYWKLLWGLKHDTGEGHVKATVKHWA